MERERVKSNKPGPGRSAASKPPGKGPRKTLQWLPGATADWSTGPAYSSGPYTESPKLRQKSSTRYKAHRHHG